MKNLIGQRFGRLMVVKRASSVGSEAAWECVCDCGNIAIGRSYNLRKGLKTSCGCRLREVLILRNTTHGLCGEDEYNTWNKMIQRCENPKCAGFGNYGGRGITVCRRWRRSFRTFLEDMGHRPSREMTLERRDTNGDYTPSNCVWATWVTQNRNRRNNRVLTILGVARPLIEWSEISHLSYKTLHSRLSYGWTPAMAIMTPVRKRA